jgi:hypothetical protein
MARAEEGSRGAEEMKGEGEREGKGKGKRKGKNKGGITSCSILSTIIVFVETMIVLHPSFNPN